MAALRDLVRQYVALTRYCPALCLAGSVAVGQALGWFLHTPEIFAAIATLGGLAAVRGRATSAAVTGIVLGLISVVAFPATRATVASSTDVQLAVFIDEEPRHPRTGEVVFIARAVDLPQQPRIRCRAVEVPWRNSSQLARGDTVWVRGPLEAVTRPGNPFSWEGWLYRRGIAGELKARWISAPIVRESPMVARVREGIAESIEARYGERRGGALFLSMAFGFQDRLSNYVEDAFRSLGLTHLLVVSGYQVSIVFGFCTAVVRRSAGLLPGSAVLRATTSIIAFIAAALYVLLVGFEMSAVRALIAAACMAAAIVCEHGSRFAQRWAVALLIMQLISPWAAFEMGVQLTFAALAGIGVGATIGQGVAWRSALWVALATWSFTSLVLISWGASISLVGVVCNLLVATPWSVLNCVVGGVGLVLGLLGIGVGDHMLDVVVLLNECIAIAVVSVWETLEGGSFSPEGALERVAALSLISLLSGVLLVMARRRALRRALRSLTRSMVR